MRIKRILFSMVIGLVLSPIPLFADQSGIQDAVTNPQRLHEGRELSQEEQLRLAARRGDLVVVESLLNSGASVNETSESGAGPLMEAVVGGHATVAEKLLAAGADGEDATDDGMTPMSAAIAAGDLMMVAVMLKNGASPNGTAFDMPLLSIAVATGNQLVVDALLSAGADPKIGSAEGMRPADVAKSLGMTALVERLGGATEFKEKPNLVAAVQQNNYDDAYRALAEGANPNQRMNGDVPILVYAAAYSTARIVEALLGAGADLLATGPEGTTPLHAAFMNPHKSGQSEIALALLKAAASDPRPSTRLDQLKARNTKGRSALVLLCANSTGENWKRNRIYRDLFSTMFKEPEAAALINSPDGDGTTPFKAAVLSGNMFLARLFGLIAEPTTDGRPRPQEIARARQDWGMLAVLPNDRALPSGLHKGAELESKKELQSRLKDWGYYEGEIDGVFGAGSRAALKSFFEDRAKELQSMAPFERRIITNTSASEDGEITFLEFKARNDPCTWHITKWPEATSSEASKFIGCVNGDSDTWNANGIALVEYSGSGWTIELFGPGGWEDRSEL